MLQLKFHIYLYMCIKMHEYICCVENNLLGTSDSNNNTKGKGSGGGFGLGDLLGRMTSDEQVEKPDMW